MAKRWVWWLANYLTWARSTLVVEGLTTVSTGRATMSSVQPSTPWAGQSFSSAQGSSSVIPGNIPPYFRSVVAAKKQLVHLVKIMKAKMTAGKGSKPKFSLTEQTYLELTYTTSTVAHVCEQVQKQWGSKYTVVSNERLEIEDCLAMQSK